jgi:syntaxin-binding protein 1
MRILMLYILFKDGILEEDLQLLLRHANLDSRSYELPLRNLDLLGHFRLTKTFAEHKSASKSRKRPKPSSGDEDSYELSRFVPPIKTVLEDLINGTLDSRTWAYTIEQPPETQPTGQQGSLRRYFPNPGFVESSQRPQWALRGKAAGSEQRQRIIVFIAGGATYSESRSCYEISKKWNRDVILGSTDMITPSGFIRELSCARESRQRLNLSIDQARSVPQQQPQQGQRYPSTPPPQSGLPSRPGQGIRPGAPHNVPGSMRPESGGNSSAGGPRPPPLGQSRSPSYAAHPHAISPAPSYGLPNHQQTSSKDNKDVDKKEKEKKKKKLGLF